MKTIIELHDQSLGLNITCLFHGDKDISGEETLTMIVDTKFVTEEYNLPWNRDGEHSEDTVETLLFVDRIFTRSLEFYGDKYMDFLEIRGLMAITEYDLDLFGAETYNGWDYDGIAQDLEMDYEEAVIHLFLYCVAKIKLELFMRESE